MKQGQIIALGIAGAAGVLAVVGFQTFMKPEVKQVVRKETINTTRVLVAKRRIGLGDVASRNSFTWQQWPSGALTSEYITYNRNRNADSAFDGSVARVTILEGEPITEKKLIQAGRGGVLAAILPRGKRAVSTKIRKDTAVGQMVLPNDHVDVILTQRKTNRTGQQEFVADTLFRNIRVLAIGQTIEVKDDKKSLTGEVATLELTPRQAEMLALANEMGTISLTLRSVADITSNENTTGDALNKVDEATGSVNVTRYGVTTRQYGVN